jgi:DNA-binding transcriptional regulator YiaG
MVSKGKLSSRGARIVKALEQFADDLDAGEPMDVKYTARTVRVIPKPSIYPPARVRAVRKLIGASPEVFAQLLAVSPMTVRSWLLYEMRRSVSSGSPVRPISLRPFVATLPRSERSSPDSASSISQEP